MSAVSLSQRRFSCVWLFYSSSSLNGSCLNVTQSVVRFVGQILGRSHCEHSWFKWTRRDSWLHAAHICLSFLCNDSYQLLLFVGLQRLLLLLLELTEELCNPFATLHHGSCSPLPALQVLLDQSTKANSPLKGHERTVQYLQRLGEDKTSSLWGDFVKAFKKSFPLIDWGCGMKSLVWCMPRKWPNRRFLCCIYWYWLRNHDNDETLGQAMTEVNYF